MIRRHWNDSRPERWEADQRRYRAHLRRIGRRLPTPLREFSDIFTLHDDRFAGGLVVPGTPYGRDSVVSVYLFRDGVVGVAALLTMHFVGVRGHVAAPPQKVDIMYFDIEVVRGGGFRLSFALDERRKWSIIFRDFAYRVYDYEAKA